MKVLHIIPSFGGGGAERQLSLLVRPLADVGAEQHIAYLHDGQNRGRCEEGGAILHRVDASSNYDPGIIFRLRTLIKELRPSLV